MTDIHDTVREVESSKQFQEFIASNEHHYLVHVFTTAGPSPGPLELGYYGKESDMITVFKTNPLVMMPPEEVFKTHGALLPLDISRVGFSTAEAVQKADKYREQGYPLHQSMRTICILQQADRPIWNMTIVTNTMNMINMKIDAQSGEMLSREMQNIMSIAKE